MRKIVSFCFILFLFSCNNDDTASDQAAVDTTYIEETAVNVPIEEPVQFKNLIWSTVYDSVKKAVSLKQQRPVSADTLTAEKLIKEINTSWDGVALKLRKISHDTIYVAIPESSVLTQQMGSSGAYSYMSTTTFILTELKNIKFVNFDFPEGDHLAPGTMKRTDFKKIMAY